LVFTIIGVVATDYHLDKGKGKHSVKVNKKYAVLSIIAALVTFILLSFI
jgi:hypothetical protein